MRRHTIGLRVGLVLATTALGLLLPTSAWAATAGSGEVVRGHLKTPSCKGLVTLRSGPEGAVARNRAGSGELVPGQENCQARIVLQCTDVDGKSYTEYAGGVANVVATISAPSLTSCYVAFSVVHHPVIDPWGGGDESDILTATWRAY
jgi:hypothetical protein